jgi:hemolysin-activating ACP:hemolysin acyltransferase
MIWGKGKSGKAAAPESAEAPQSKSNGGESKAAAGSAAVAPARAAAAPASAGPASAGKSASATAQQQAQFAQLFSQAVAVLMRDANYKNLPLRELEFLLPPIMVGHCAIANAKSAADGPFVPVALALWARVSPSVDKRLSENLEKPIELKPNEWTSGSIPWLITLAGSTKALPAFVKQLCDQQFKGQQVKMRASDKSGKRTIQLLSSGKAPA